MRVQSHAFPRKACSIFCFFISNFFQKQQSHCCIVWLLLTIGNYILNYIISRPKLAPFVIQALAQVCMLVVFGYCTISVKCYLFHIELAFTHRIFTHTRWLFSCCSVFHPVACGYMLFYSVMYRIKQHVPTSIRTKNTATGEQPPRMCKNSISKMKSDLAIGQHLITNPECAKTYTDDNFRIIGQARSSLHLGVLESVYIKTQNPVLCNKSSFSHLDSSSKQW